MYLALKKSSATTYIMKEILKATDIYVNSILFLSYRNDHGPFHRQIQVQRPECENQGVVLVGDTRQLRFKFSVKFFLRGMMKCRGYLFKCLYIC